MRWYHAMSRGKSSNGKLARLSVVMVGDDHAPVVHEGRNEPVRIDREVFLADILLRVQIDVMAGPGKSLLLEQQSHARRAIRLAGVIEVKAAERLDDPVGRPDHTRRSLSDMMRSDHGPEFPRSGA